LTALLFAPFGDVRQFLTELAAPFERKLGMTIIGLAPSF